MLSNWAALGSRAIALSRNSTCARLTSLSRLKRASKCDQNAKPFLSLFFKQNVGLQPKYLSRTMATTSIDSTQSNSKQPVLITTPIFYVNGAPHIGHFYSVLVGDALARWHRLLGHPTLYTVGTDEHGIKVQEAAAKKGVPVKQFCDDVTQSFSSLWREANISFDDYIRTTEERHKKAVLVLWNELAKKDKIYLGEFEGWYSISDETFFTELQVQDEISSEDGKPTGRKVSIETGNVVQWLKEPNYKFRLSEFVAPLLSWIEKEHPIYPPVREHEIVQDLTARGLRDLSVSRLKEKIQWGISVPGDPNHVIYVWLDALTNYLTVCGYPDWEISPNALELKRFWPASYHIIGKDIAKFHSVYWPSFLLSAGLPLPKKVITHGHWTKDKKKISKSLGNVVEPRELIAQFGLDPIRFVLLRQGGLAHDGDYNAEEAQNIITDELANSLGNLIARITGKGVNPDLSWPRPTPEVFTPAEQDLVSRLQSLPSDIDLLYKNCEFSKAIVLIFGLLGDANLTLTNQAPWKLIPKAPKLPKDAPAGTPIPPTPSWKPDDRIRYENSLYVCFEAVRVCTLLLQPVIPQLSDALLSFIGIDQTKRNPFSYPYGVDYASHSTLPQLTGELFVLIDERNKKQARFEQKQQKQQKKDSAK